MDTFRPTVLNDGAGGSFLNKDKDPNKRKFYRAFKAGILDEDKITSEGWKAIYEYELEEGYIRPDDLSIDVINKYNVDTSLSKPVIDPIEEINTEPIDTELDTQDRSLKDRLLSFFEGLKTYEPSEETIHPISKKYIDDFENKNKIIEDKARNLGLGIPSEHLDKTQLGQGIRPSFNFESKEKPIKDDPLLIALEGTSKPETIGQYYKNFVDEFNKKFFKDKTKEESQLKTLDNDYLPSEATLSDLHRKARHMDNVSATGLRAFGYGLVEPFIGSMRRSSQEIYEQATKPWEELSKKQPEKFGKMGKAIEETKRDIEHWNEEKIFNTMVGKSPSELTKGEKTLANIGSFAGNIGKLLLFSKAIGSPTGNLMLDRATLGFASGAESAYGRGEEDEKIVKEGLINAGAFSVGAKASELVGDKLIKELTHVYKLYPEWGKHLTALVRSSKGLTHGVTGTATRAGLSKAFGEDTELELKDAIQSGLIMALFEGIITYVNWPKLGVNENELKKFNIRLHEVSDNDLKSNGYIKLADLERTGGEAYISKENPFAGDIYVNLNNKDIVVMATKENGFLVPKSMVQGKADTGYARDIRDLSHMTVRRPVEHTTQPDYIDKAREPKKYDNVLNKFMDNEGYREFKDKDGNITYGKYNRINEFEGTWEYLSREEAEQKFEREYFSHYEDIKPDLDLSKIEPARKDVVIGKFKDDYEVNRQLVNEFNQSFAKDLREKGYKEHKPGLWVLEKDNKILDVVPEFTTGKDGKAIPLFDIEEVGKIKTTRDLDKLKGLTGEEYDIKKSDISISEKRTELEGKRKDYEDYTKLIDEAKQKSPDVYDEYTKNYNSIFELKEQSKTNKSMQKFINDFINRKDIKKTSDFIKYAESETDVDNVIKNMNKFNQEFNKYFNIKKGEENPISKFIDNTSTLDEVKENIKSISMAKDISKDDVKIMEKAKKNIDDFLNNEEIKDILNNVDFNIVSDSVNINQAIENMREFNKKFKEYFEAEEEIEKIEDKSSETIPETEEIKPIDITDTKDTKTSTKADIEATGEETSQKEYDIVRIDSKDAKIKPSEKPQGLYVSIDREGFENPHTDVGDTEYKGTVKPNNPLVLQNKKVKHKRFEYHGIDEGYGSAGILALKELLPESEFNDLLTKSKSEMIEILNEKYPGPDYNKYFDSYELLEAYGGQLAKDKGYDALMLEDKEFPNLSEIVVLDDNIINIKSTEKPTTTINIDKDEIGSTIEGKHGYATKKGDLDWEIKTDIEGDLYSAIHVATKDEAEYWLENKKKMPLSDEEVKLLEKGVKNLTDEEVEILASKLGFIDESRGGKINSYRPEVLEERDIRRSNKINIKNKQDLEDYIYNNIMGNEAIFEELSKIDTAGKKTSYLMNEIDTAMALLSSKKYKDKKFYNLYKENKNKKFIKEIADKILKELEATERSVTKDITPTNTLGQDDIKTSETESPVGSDNILKGNATTAKTNDGKDIELEYQVVSADNLIASHTISLHKNPNYPEELQPRDRSKQTSIMQVDNIINNLNPEWLGESPKVSDGSPIVGPDYVVESGNGRVIALQKMYNTGHNNKGKYLKWLEDNKSKFGIKGNLPNNPILVRVRKSDVDRVEFTRQANVSEVASLSILEQAKIDSEKLDHYILSRFSPNDEGKINTKENKNFIKTFIDNIIPKSEHNKYIDSKGNITQDAILRIRNAIFYKVYQDESILSKIAESTDNNIKVITNTLLNIAPRLLSIRDLIDKGTLYDLDFSKDIIEAVNKYVSLKNEDMTVKEFINQVSMFGDEISNESKVILLTFEENNRSVKKLMTYFNFVFEGIGGTPNPKQESLLDEKIPKKIDILDYAERRFNESEKGIIEGQTKILEEVQQTNSGETSEGTEEEGIERETKIEDAEYSDVDISSESEEDKRTTNIINDIDISKPYIVLGPSTIRVGKIKDGDYSEDTEEFDISHFDGSSSWKYRKRSILIDISEDNFNKIIDLYKKYGEKKIQRNILNVIAEEYKNKDNKPYVNEEAIEKRIGSLGQYSSELEKPLDKKFDFNLKITANKRKIPYAAKLTYNPNARGKDKVEREWMKKDTTFEGNQAIIETTFIGKPGEIFEIREGSSNKNDYRYWFILDNGGALRKVADIYSPKEKENVINYLKGELSYKELLDSTNNLVYYEGKYIEKGGKNVEPSEDETRGVEERDKSTEGRDTKTSERDKRGQSESGEVSTTQKGNNEDIQSGNEPISIDQDTDRRTDRDDTSDVSRDEKDGIPKDVVTKPVSNAKAKRKNLKLNIEDDWLYNIAKNNSDYYIRKERIKMNEKALEILNKPSKDITDEDKQILKNYTGKGGLGESGKEILTQYFTDYKTVDMIYKKIEQMGFNINNIKALDPSTGVGVFMGLSPDGIKFDAIDIDPIVTEIASILYPDNNIMTKGFEEHRVDNEYDLVITNVPFSNSRGAGIIKDKPNIRNLHDYFVLASLDKAKDNGLVALITPSSVMDSIDPKIRRMIDKDAEFLGAYRLPSDVFKKTGTDAITDIIFLRRRVRNSIDEDKTYSNNLLFLETTMIGKDDLDISWNTNVKTNDLIPINAYYKQNPQNMLGSLTATTNRYGQNVIKISGVLDDKQINKVLNDDIKYEKREYKSDVSSERLNTTQAIYFESKDTDITPIGGIFEKDGKWYIRSQIKGKDKVIVDKGEEVELTDKEIELTKAMLEIASLSQSLRVSARKKASDDELKKLTDKLKKEVDSFKKKYKKDFGEKSYINKVSSDPRYFIVKVLMDDPDIFKKDTLKVRDYEIDLEDKNNLNILSQHLLYKYGEITIDNFSENYQGGISRERAKNILDSSELFFKQPSEIEIEEFDKFGNVELKTIKTTPNSYVRKVDYLSGNIYKKIEAVEKEIEKGNKEYEKNLKALKAVIPKEKTLSDIRLSVKHKWIDPGVIESFLTDYLEIQEASVKLNELNQFDVRLNDYGNPKVNKLKIDKFTFYEWFPKYMNGNDLNVMVDGKKDRIASSKATSEMKKVDDEFNRYLKSNPDISKDVLNKYNYIFNNYVPKEKEDIIIPGKNKDWKFRDNQIEFINMALSLGTGVNAQRTGAGKTATNVAVNHMLKVTGRANKPIAVVPGKVIKKFVRDVLEGSRGLPSIFPDMKILDVTEYNFNEAMARIAFNEWDLILMPDTWFKRISLTPEREIEYIEEEIERLEISERKRATERGKKRSKKQFEKALENLKQRLAELRNYVRNDGIYFEDLGIDAISLDEAQSVKNLVASVKGQDLGMSATPSQTAMDFNMKAKYIIEIKNGKNIFLYTATPVSNSILEIYGLLQNIAPQEWVDRGIYTADDFIEAYCDTSETIGITKENEVGIINKVDGFVNIDDLRGLFKKYVDYRPFIEGAIIPDLKEEKYIIGMSDWQRAFFNDILERLQLIKAREPKEFEDDNGDIVIDNVMKVLGDARRGSISKSLITGDKPTLKDSPKIAKGIEVVSKIYKETGKNQIIFLDQYGDSLLGKDNLHNFIKKELTKNGIPSKEIVIVNGKINNSVDKKLKIQDEFNDGKYKVIIGTTESIGAGMDLQEKTISIINLDIPWTPTSVTQRKGRGERPGNEHELIANIDIFVKGSYDAWSTNIVGVKKKWQDQLLEGSGDSENGYLKNQDDDDYDIDSIISELIEDPMEKAKLNFEVTRKKKLLEISSIKDNIEKEKDNIKNIDNSIKDRKNKIDRYANDLNNPSRSKLAKMRIEQHTKAIDSLEEELNEAYERLERHETQLSVETDSYESFINEKEKILELSKEKSIEKPETKEDDINQLIEKLIRTNQLKGIESKKIKPKATQGYIPISKVKKYQTKKETKIKPISDIIDDIRKDFNISISSKRFRSRRGEAGQYKTHSESIRTKQDNDIQTVSHELGHHLDKKYRFTIKYEDIINDFVDSLEFPEEYDEEEIPFEAVAEFIRLYLVTEDEAYNLSNEFYNIFTSELTREDLKNLNKHKEDIINWYSSEIDKRIGTTIRSHTEVKKTPLNRKLLEMEMWAFDDLAPIRILSEFVEKTTGEKLDFEKHPYVLAFQSRRAGMIAKSQIAYALTNPQGEVIGPSFIEVLESIDKDERDYFDRYLKTKHAITLNEFDKQVFSDDFTIEDLIIAKEKYERDFPHFEEVSENLYEWWSTFVEEWIVKEGFLSWDTWLELKAKYPTYVPNFRALDEIDMDKRYSKFSKKGFGNQHTPIKRMKGSAKDTYPVTESLVLYIDKIVKTQKRNEVGLAIHNLYHEVEGLGQFITKVEHEKELNRFNAIALKEALKQLLIIDYIDNLKGKEKEEADKILKEKGYNAVTKYLTEKGIMGPEIIDTTIDDIITYFTPRYFSTDSSIYTIIDEKGNTHFYEVHDPLLLEAMLNLNDKDMSKVTQLVGKAKRVFTDLTTGGNPIFGLTSNIWGDVPEAYVFGSYKNPFEFGKELAKSIKEIKTKDETVLSYYAMGGGLSSPISPNRKLMQETLNQLFPDMKKTDIKSMVDYGMSLIEQFNDTIESMPRFTEYKKVLKKHGNTYEGRLRAMYESGDVTVNFLRRGRIHYTIIGQGVPFLNAGLQGLYKFNQEFIRKKGPGRGNGGKGKDNKKYMSILIKALMSITAFQILEMIWHEDDEDYQNLSDFIKDNYWILHKYAPGKFIRVRKPRELGLLFGTMFRRGFMSVFENDPEAWNNFTDAFMNVMLPPNPLTEHIFSPISEVYRNKDWKGSPIIPKRLEGLPYEQQYDESTSKIANALSKIVPKRMGNLKSPKSIDYVIQQYTGIIGQILIPATRKDITVLEALGRKMTTDVAYSNDIVNEFYKTKEKLDTAYRLYNERGTKSKDFDPILRDRYNEIYKEVSDIWDKIKVINEDEKLTMQHKKTKERELRLEIMKVLNEDNLKPTSYNEFKVIYNKGKEITDKYKETIESTGKKPKLSKEEEALLILYNIPIKGNRSFIKEANYQINQINKRIKQIEETKNINENRKSKAIEHLKLAEHEIANRFMEIIKNKYNIDIKSLY